MSAVALYAAQKASDTAWSLDASGTQRADLINKLASLAEIMACGAGVRGVLRLLLLAGVWSRGSRHVAFHRLAYVSPILSSRSFPSSSNYFLASSNQSPHPPIA
ncbi:hypothetical protein K438DRAFT_1960668 [Mycena galopus ATCC 62051]|nr:hypothetical protein K438DRAFT_1960668 [Mycena galopus ATCC 62051]